MASPVTDLKLTARYAHTELVIEAELPVVADIPDLVRAWKLDAVPQETMWVLALDSLSQVRTVVEVARGGYHEVDIPLAALLSVPLLASSDRMVIMHNHPAGDVTPTKADLDMTRRIMVAGNTCGIYLDDSVIVGPGGAFFSLLQNGFLKEPEDYKRKAKYRQRVTLNGGTA